MYTCGHCGGGITDGRWVITAGGHGIFNTDRGELKACEVETGIMLRATNYQRSPASIFPRTERNLLVSGSRDLTVLIWGLGKYCDYLTRKS